MLKLLLETSLLLLVGQALLGGLGFGAGALPWPYLGLPITASFIWLVIRTALVMREEMAKARKRGAMIVPWRMALFTGVLWQVPALAVAPSWFPEVWQGALLPIRGTFGLLWPEAAAATTPWLWVAALGELALFALVAGRSTIRPALRGAQVNPAQRPVAAGEWVPARRRKDIVRKKMTGADLETD